MPITKPKNVVLVELGRGDVGISTLTLDVGVAIVLEPLGRTEELGSVAGDQPEAKTIDDLRSIIQEPFVLICAAGADGVRGLDVLIAKLEQARSALVSGGPRVA